MVATTGKGRAGAAALRWCLAPARLLERTRGRKRVALIGVYGFVVVLFGLLLWRQSRLAGLPDIGDPFDPAALYGLQIPDEENAFVLYAQAQAKAKRDTVIERRLLNSPYAWPPASDTEGIAFLKSNAEALSLWRQGCERPDGLYVPLRELSFETSLPLLQDHRHFFRLALVEASRCESAGDMAGAWDWYRATLRGSRLVGRHTCLIGRLIGCAEYCVSQTRINAWAADPRVDATLLKRALDDVYEANTMTARNSECIEIEYLSGMKMIKDTKRLLKFFYDDPWAANQQKLTVWVYHLPGYWTARWFVENEPRVTRLGMQLTYANWLSQADLLPEARARLIGQPASSRKLFDIEPPRGALRPVALIERMESSFLADIVFPSFDGVIKALDRDLKARAGLIMTLADQLYMRKYGKPAKSVDDLIGTCLERFPEGYVKPAELDAL